MTPLKVLVIVDDEADMRALVRAVLAEDDRLEVIGEAASAEEAIPLARSIDPGLIVLDHSLGAGATGLEAAPALREAAPSAKILLFTAHDMAREARREPAIDGYLRKDDVGQLLPVVDRLLGLEPLSA